VSLTSELADSASKIGEFVRFVGAMADSAQRGSPFEPLQRQVLGLDVMPRQVGVTPVPGANGGTVGTAFDYRLRYHLAPCLSEAFVARHGYNFMSMLDMTGVTRTQLDWFFENLDELTGLTPTAGQHLGDADEALLCRYCVVLAYLEAVYRTGGSWQPELPPAASERSSPASETLLALAPAAVVQDVVNLSRSAESAFAPLISAVTSGVSCQLNPTFAGSHDIHGADADFLLGDTLFELKTTKTLNPRAVRDAVLQLIGYLLLDYDDHHHIRRLGLYAARQEWVITWPAWEFLLPPAEVLQRLASQTEPAEDEVMARIAKLRFLMSQVVSGHKIACEAAFGEA
jgi:hypothetical protein